MPIRRALAGLLTLALAAPVTGLVVNEDAQALDAPAATIRDTPLGEVFGAAIGADDTSYVVGSFTRVGAMATNLSRFDSNAVVNRSFPTTNGAVYAVTPATDGGWFIGGSFTRVGNTQRTNFARITSSGQVDPDWDVAVAGFNVLAIKVVDDTLILGGNFTQVGGQARANLAAIDTDTRAVLSWTPNPNAGVNAIASDDSAVYVGGDFTSINSSPRPFAAAFNRPALTLSSWNPAPSALVSTFATAPGKVYVGGDFTSIGGQIRNRIAAVKSVSTDDSAALPWNPNVNAPVRAIAVDDSVVYVGGQFTLVNGGQARNCAAAFDDTGTVLTSWNPNPTSTVRSLVPTSAGVFMGGDFLTVGNTQRTALVLVDKTTGALEAWNAGIDTPPGGSAKVFSLSSDAAGIMVGGQFTYVNAVPRNRAAAFDSQGRLTPWNPNLNSVGYSITLKGSTALVAGAFTTVNNGIARNYAAGLRTDDTGSATGWNPNLNALALSIALDDTLIYLGGDFTTVNGGITRNRAASFDDTGNVTTWNPNVNGSVRDFAFVDDTAYLVGAFTAIGGTPRSRAAAVRTDDTGTLTSWDPSPSDEVQSIELSGAIAYLGGKFTTIGGVNRTFAAAVRMDDTGTATGWGPNIACAGGSCGSRGIRAIAVGPNAIYLGGYFTAVGGANALKSLAAVSPNNAGVPLVAWNPIFTPSTAAVNSLTLKDSGLYASGSYTSLRLSGTDYTPNFSTLPTAVTAPLAPTGVAAAPGDASASIAWTPSYNGGASVTRVDIALDDTSRVYATSANTTSPLTITGLTNGTTYTAYVRLANSAGNGDWSLASAPFTPQASPRPPSPNFPPGPPTQVAATPDNASATVTWTPPASTGTFPITGYVVTASPGGRTCTTSTMTCTVTGLTNGTAYIFTVTAASAAGTGPASTPSAPVTPRTIPGPPTTVKATPGDARATITWSPPADDGGSPITGYRVTTIPTSDGCTVTATSCTLDGLANGREYVVSVVATNVAGSSAPITVAVTPRGKASIVITGTRGRNDPSLVKILGTVTNLDVATVQPYIRLGRAREFQPSLTQATVGDEGRFRWQRITSKRITVYVEVAGTMSNRVTIPAR